MPMKKKPTVEALRPTLYEQPGAPTKLSADRLKIICDEVAAGASFRDAAHMADISEQTLAR